MFDSEVQERPAEAWLSLDSDFGAAKDDAKGLLAQKYGARGLAFDVDRYSSSLQTDDIVCTARENGFIVGTMTVRFDREQPLNADQIFAAELNQ